MTRDETVVPGHATGEHVVQLFDTDDSLAATVSRFLLDGILNGGTLLVVSTRPHWDAIARRLDEAGVAVSDAGHSGQLTWRDATETLNASMNHGRLDPDRFDNSVGALVRQLASRGTGLRIYGEMVDLLAAEGDYRSAQALEELWNALAVRETFTLLCGYSAAHFGDPRTADALSAVCRAHTYVRFNPRDVLASHLSNPPSASRRGVR